VTRWQKRNKASEAMLTKSKIANLFIVSSFIK
jgi:hypothetical protein